MVLPIWAKYPSPYCSVFVHDAVQHRMLPPHPLLFPLPLPLNALLIRDADPAGTPLLRLIVIDQQPVSPFWICILTASTC